MSIKLEKIAFVLEFKSNFILLNKLKDNKIIYHDNLSSMLLIQDNLPITYIKRD